MTTFTGLNPNSPFVNRPAKAKMETGSLNKYFPYFIFLDLLETLAYKAKPYWLLTNPSFSVGWKFPPSPFLFQSPSSGPTENFSELTKKQPKISSQNKKTAAATDIFALKVIIFLSKQANRPAVRLSWILSSPAPEFGRHCRGNGKPSPILRYLK